MEWSRYTEGLQYLVLEIKKKKNKAEIGGGWSHGETESQKLVWFFSTFILNLKCNFSFCGRRKRMNTRSGQKLQEGGHESLPSPRERPEG